MNRARGYLPDGLLALALLAVGLMGTAPAGRNQGVPSIPGWAYALVVTAALAPAVRRLLPMQVLAVCTAAVCGYLLSGNPYGPIMLSLAIAVYTVAAHRPLRAAAVAATGSLVLLIVAGLLGGGLDTAAVAPQVAWVAGPLAIGVTVRVGREQVLQNRRDEARRQADAERLRVAQEVHDVVGHGLAAIMMQADVALHLLPKQPEQAEAALTAISRTSRESLDELRTTLGAVRRGDDPDDRSPAPGLAHLNALVDRTRAVGVPVTVDLTGPLASLPTAVDLAAYRIVQESLTNVLRHAGAATATVQVTLTDANLTVSVTDTGRGALPTPAPAGHGLAGMKERASALGGSLTAGPRPEGGFAVTAALPVRR
ncbi:sensor histidine kinase [Actinoplanes sp. NPDC049599]|uniref:sensor histidine kinase n=1 Tax=Actinoplanes sp. NPDC049599 TaxID=3363903 RepID=UPI0037AA3CDF